MSTTWQKVHLFISGTFNDMHAERDYLVKRVFPDLRDWCEDRKLRLVDIDLRWGVTEADASNKNAVKICLEHINKCRPFFVCFLGQRHGYAPGQEGISSETFDEFPELRTELHPAASITELEIRHATFRPLAWRDPKNQSRLIRYNLAEHAFFYFREPDYLENLKKTLFAEMQRERDEACEASDPEKLNGAARHSFRTYTDEIGPEDETEDEREQRELSIEALQDVKRDIVGHDITQSLAHQPVKYNARWRSDLRAPELALPLECPFQDETGRQNWRKAWNRWAHLGLDSADLLIPGSKQALAQRHNETLTRGRLSTFRTVEETREQFPPGAELASIIQHDLREAILARYPDRREIPETTELQREIDQHEEFISNSVEGFIERGDDFVELDRYVESDSNKLFVLWAAGGMGKSTLLANWVDRYRARIKDLADHSVHFRFIGQSDESGTVYALLRSLLGEIREVALKLDEEIPLDPRELRQKLPELLVAIGRRGAAVIVIDALDQLESGLSDLNWIPQQLPENIKLIVSFKREGEASEEVFKRFESSGRVRLSEVKPFKNEEDRESLVRVYLLQYLKELDKPHLETLIRLRGASNPLYLKVVLSELRVFGVFASLREKIRSDFGDTPISAFAGVLNRLESDPAYSPIDPKEAVPLLFGLLAHARRGLSVDELTNLFIQTLPQSEDNHEWREAITDKIYLLLRQVRPFMARREGRYDFFFNSFRLAAQQRYVATSSDDQIPKRPFKQWHGILADYFYDLPTWQEATPPSGTAEAAGSKPPTRRKVAELPFHLTQAEEWKRLEETLCDLGFIEAKCTAGMTYDLVTDYHAALAATNDEEAWPGRTQVKEFSRFLEGQAYILNQHPVLTFQQAANQPDISATAVAARTLWDTGTEKRAWLRWVNKPQHRDPCVITLFHENQLLACAYSPDGRQLVSVSIDGTLTTWDAKTGEFVAQAGRESNPESNPWIIYGCAYSPDGRRIICGQSRSSSLEVWDAETGEEVMTLAGHQHVVRACAYSPDGRRIVSGSADKTLKVWDAETGEEIITLIGFEGEVRACAYSPDGRRIVAGSTDNTIRVWDAENEEPSPFSVGYFGRLGLSQAIPFRAWDAETGEVIAPLDERRNWVSACAYSPDSRRIVSGSSDGTLKVWDAETGKKIATLAGHKLHVTTCAYSPDGRWIVSGSADNTIKVGDAETGEEVITLTGHRDFVTSCTFSPDGLRIVSTSHDKTLKVWDAETRTEVAMFGGHTRMVRACAFSPDGRRIVSASSDKTLKVWDTKTGAQIATLTGHTGEVEACAYSPDSRWIVSRSYDDSTGEEMLKLWDAETGREVATLEEVVTSSLAHYYAKKGFIFSPDGRRVVSILEMLKVWDTGTGAKLATATVDGSVIAPAYSPDSMRIVSVWHEPRKIWDAENTLKVWDAETGEEILTLKGHEDTVRACTYSPDGRWIVSGSEDKTLKVWDAVTGQEIATLSGSKWALNSDNQELVEDYGEVNDCVYSPDGRRIIAAYFQMKQLEALRRAFEEERRSYRSLLYERITREPVRRPDFRSGILSGLGMWDAETGEEAMRLRGHRDYARVCTYSPDGLRIFSGSPSGSGLEDLEVWDAKTGKQVANLAREGNSCKYSPDGRRIVTNGMLLKVWDIKTGKEIGRFVTPGKLIEAVALGTDTRHVVAGATDGTVYVLHLMGIEFNAPILTPVYLYRFDSKQWDNEPTTRCEWCSQRFVPPATVLDAIRGITRNMTLSLHDSPCVKLPAEAWDEPPLLSECPHCHMSLKFNPFIVDNRDRIIKPVERKAPKHPSSTTPHPNADAEHASRLTQYQHRLTLWEALPWWKRLMTKKPEPPTGV